MTKTSTSASKPARKRDAAAKQKPAPAQAAAPTAKRPPPDKPQKPGKDTQLHIRITAEQREEYDRAAAFEGLDLSSWVRTTLRKAARAILVDEKK